MAKIRKNASIENGLMKVLKILTDKEIQDAIGKTSSYLRKCSNPDLPQQIDQNEDGIIEAIAFDDNENKNFEIFLFDDDLDGNADRAEIDNDDNGTSDVMAYDYDQDGEWDKYDEIS